MPPLTLIELLSIPHFVTAWETLVEAALAALPAENERSKYDYARSEWLTEPPAYHSQCDEARPGCRRCAQVRKTCPGYPFQIQLGLRLPPESQPPTVQGFTPTPAIPHDPTLKTGSGQRLPVETYLPPPTTASPPYSSRSSSDEVEIKAEEKDALLHSTAPKHDDRPESPPKYDIQHQSICFFVHLFCSAAIQLYSFPIIDFIPHILGNASPTSSVSLAATAVSRMTLADQYSGTDIRLQTGHDYSRAITSTFASIRNPSSATTDSTVIAVWLLGLYEAINSVLSHGRRTSATTQPPPRTPEEEWQSHILHIRGAMHLLRLRGTTQFTNPRSEKIFRVFKAAIQMRLFTLNSVTSKDFGDLELDLYQDEHEFVPSKTGSRASAFFLRIARLIEEIKHFLLSSDRTSSTDETISSKTQQFIALGESLDNEMIGWADVEPGWQMMKVPPPPSSSAKGVATAWSLYPHHALYYFYSFWVYLYWIRFLMARIKLYESLIALVESDPLLSHSRRAGGQDELQAAKAGQVEAYKMVIRGTADQIVGLTAYALGDVASTGNFNSAVSAVNPGGGVGMQEMNVVAAMQLVIPLKSLLRSEYMTAQQRGAIDLAIILIGDGYRRRPAGFG